MLLVRVASALIGIPLTLWISYIGGSIFNISVLIIILLGIHEYGNMVHKGGMNTCTWVMYPGAVLAVLSHIYPEYAGPLLFLILCAFLFSIIFSDFSPEETVYSFFGIFYIAWTLGHLISLRQNLPNGYYMIILLMLITWSTDTGAYFIGRWLGRHKLCPRISPKKTVEGAVGGLIISIFVVWLFAQYISVLLLKPLLILAVSASVIGQLGDLAESVWKRWAGIKDSGTLIPGHGGVLDRCDSLILTTPLVYYYLAAFIIQ